MGKGGEREARTWEFHPRVPYRVSQLMKILVYNINVAF